MDDLHTAHALWVLTVCAVVGVIAAGNVTCVISRIVDALTPLLIRIVQLEREQLDAMEKQVVQDGQGAQAQPNEDWKARHLN
ncbi:hypothetical protein [Thermomonospora cellulosilytica]|uniref:Uncharacterized protein n=1 Tax=Thermomonospora cellulosilytica TaxID=1411118 RepID=A0A7W3R808_9ACTN|nr:hypothetical protein [Thermomonospora cellulosilytica]MBA9003778.1 hypothetical protein [Thermomonospora cellulosilytica]